MVLKEESLSVFRPSVCHTQYRRDDWSICDEVRWMHTTNLFFVLCALFLSADLTGCAQMTNTVVSQVPSHSQNIQNLKNNQIITLDGVITKVGPASGKSMAAWNGFDVGEMVYRFEPSPTESIHAQSIRLHVPERLVVFVYLNRVIRLLSLIHI